MFVDGLRPRVPNSFASFRKAQETINDEFWWPEHTKKGRKIGEKCNFLWV